LLWIIPTEQMRQKVEMLQQALTLHFCAIHFSVNYVLKRKSNVLPKASTYFS
jgi:hypothetical protein